jgi:AcrR family transcriptional regulator
VPTVQRYAPRSYQSSRREAQARRTRQRILGAATSVFLAKGYVGTTMRAVALAAGVSVPTLELLFGTKGRLLKAAIDVAIAGDDDVVPMLDRDWTGAAMRAGSVEEFFSIVAGVIAPAQHRSAGLVLAAFEGSSTDTQLAELADQMINQRSITAGWIIDALTGQVSLRPECSKREAVETLWLLMDPALFHRLIEHRGWSVEKYERWFARSAARLLIADSASISPPTHARRRQP